MNESQNFLELIKPHRVISIIGMMKNVGKTTTLNFIINKFWDTHLFGLTSIGRDGELEDIVTCTPKPKIYVKKGTYLATAKECYFNCDITKEVIEKPKIYTAIGQIIIVRALSDGFVELAGPSILSDLSEISNKLKELDCDMILIDGAISRKSFATPIISDATILCTGAEVSSDINEVIRETKYIVNLFNINKIEDDDLLKLIQTSLKTPKVALISSDFSFKILQVKTALDSAKLISKNLSEDTRYILIRGVLTDKLIQELMNTSDFFGDLCFIVEDATKIFLTEQTFENIVMTGAEIKVINKINLICVISNPFSPTEGFKFNATTFLKKLENSMNVPVFDLKLMGGGKNN